VCESGHRPFLRQNGAAEAWAGQRENSLLRTITFPPWAFTGWGGRPVQADHAALIYWFALALFDACNKGQSI